MHASIVWRHTRRSANVTQPNFAKRKEVLNGTDASRITWRRIVDVNATIEIGCCGTPKHFKLALQALRRAALRWQLHGTTSLIATFSNCILKFPNVTTLSLCSVVRVCYRKSTCLSVTFVHPIYIY